MFFYEFTKIIIYKKKGTGEGWGEGGGYWRDHEKKGQDPDEIDAHGNKVDNGYN